jgi:septal ring factor EnvC (AmiA/AmiB activator)
MELRILRLKLVEEAKRADEAESRLKDSEMERYDLEAQLSACKHKLTQLLAAYKSADNVKEGLDESQEKVRLHAGLCICKVRG